MATLTRRKINTYMGILVVTIVGSVATLIITHIANATNFDGYDGGDPLAQISDLNVSQ